MKICTKICDECPFSNKSPRGWLADYTVEDFAQFFRLEVLFPCHKQIKDDLNFNQAAELVKTNKVKLCRGYVESMRKSAKLPVDPELANIVKNVALSDDSMSIFEFFAHHQKEEKQ